MPARSRKSNVATHWQLWREAKRKYRLSDMHITMASELGLNPKKFGKYAANKNQPWKVPLRDFIEAIYRKRFGRERPLKIKSIRDYVDEAQARQRAQSEARKKKPIQKGA